MARPFAPEAYIQWKVHIPATLAAQVELHFFDRVRGKPKYASRSKLLVELISRWLDEQKGATSV